LPNVKLRPFKVESSQNPKWVTSDTEPWGQLPLFP